MLLRLAYLGITNAFALLRLLPGSDQDKDTEILALRHQLAVLQRQLDGQRVRFDPADRPRRRRDHGRAQRRPRSPDECRDGTLGADMPARATRPDADLQPATSAARATRVRALLQRTQTASR